MGGALTIPEAHREFEEDRRTDKMPMPDSHAKVVEQTGSWCGFGRRESAGDHSFARN